MVTNDAKFLSGDVFSGREFGEFLIDHYDVLRSEAQDKTRMMSIGLHSRIIGHPGRLAGLLNFLDHIKDHDDIWVCKRSEIADFWRAQMAPQGRLS